MERHETREEALWAVNKPVVMLVGLPKDLANVEALPKIDEIKAFKLVPGQIVIMDKGTWHSPALAIEKGTFYYYAIEKSSIPEKDVMPWKEFQNKEIVEMVFN